MRDKKRKRRGASLMYVLIIMSILTVCTINFVYFIKERAEIIKSRKN